MRYGFAIPHINAYEEILEIYLENEDEADIVAPSTKYLVRTDQGLRTVAALYLVVEGQRVVDVGDMLEVVETGNGGVIYRGLSKDVFDALYYSLTGEEADADYLDVRLSVNGRSGTVH
mgnify:CR=1 FL=1